MGFEDIIGQEEVKQRLVHEADAGRLPHALLLTGPEGCGKMPIALALSKYLCCSGEMREIANLQWDQLIHPDVKPLSPCMEAMSAVSSPQTKAPAPSNRWMWKTLNR